MAKHKLTLNKIIPLRELKNTLRDVQFRGIYNSKGSRLYPYKNAVFTLATVYPSKTIGLSPTISIGKKKFELFSPQPTIYQNQLEIIKTVDTFLKNSGYALNTLEHGIEYEWADRGVFHILPPIIEKHTYYLQNGFFDLDRLISRFRNCYTKDARGNLHDLSKRYLKSFFIDEVSHLKHLDIFHSNAPLINYGLGYTGNHNFYIVCDGIHRLDYALEVLQKPIRILVVENKNKPLMPYYAFPTPFCPTIRLSSKRSERMYPRLERDKIHLFNDFIKKIPHYDWGTLNVSSLRTQTEFY
jgi:hypothetical protein